MPVYPTQPGCKKPAVLRGRAASGQISTRSLAIGAVERGFGGCSADSRLTTFP